MKKILFALLAMVSVGAKAQFSEFRPGAVADGVNYALPRTGFKADITALKVSYVPGEFARFAERYLHILNVKQEAEVEWVMKDVRFSQFGEPDSLKYFTVKLKDKSVAPMAQLTKDGVLVSINKNVELQEDEYPSSIKTNHKLDGKKYLTPDILAATSTAKMAELTAQEIFDIRESKNNIRRGQVEAMPKDGESLRIVLADLDAQENALTQLFVGYSDTTSVCETYSLVPEKDLDNEVLFRFSRKLGFVDVDDVAGVPYYISIKNQHTVPMPTEAEAKKRKVQGLVYNMPSSAKVVVKSATSTLYEKTIPFAQFGTIDVLASSLFGKGSTVKIEFNPATGGILHVEQ